MNEATTNLTELSGAECVTAADVRVGDYVFSTTGQPDRVIRVSDPLNNRKRVTITPENLWPLVLAPTDTITIKRRESSRQTRGGDLSR